MSHTELMILMTANAAKMTGLASFGPVLSRADGTLEIIKPTNGTDFQLGELYRLIGCEMIEVIYLNNGGEDDDLIMIGDEEARLKDESNFNMMATGLYCTSWRADPNRYNIVGDVILCPSRMLR